MSSGSSNSQSVAPATPSSLTTSSPATSSTPTSASANPSPTSNTSTNGATSSQSTSAVSTSGSSSATTQSTSTSSTLGTTTPAFVTTSGGTTLTVTAVVTPASTSTTANHTSSSNSFFSNTGAVAGVFTVVGLVVLALVIVFITNAVRRRRAQKFDRDVAEAAAEAVASSRSPFEDYSYGNTGGHPNGGGGGGGGGGGAYGYSDNSHGTYQLPPLQPNEQYNMTEMSQYDPYAAGAASMAAAAAPGRSRSRKESEPGAPGIAGVGAGTLAREPSKRAPYHAFAGPGPQPHELQGSNGTMPARRNQDMLEAAGLAGAAAPVTRRPSETTTQNTHFSSRSQQFGSVSSQHQPSVPGPLQPGYPVVDSYYPQRHDSLSPDPFAAAYPPVTTRASQGPLPNPHEAAQQPPSPPLPGHQSDHNEDIGDTGSPTALRSDEQRLSYQDDVDYSQGQRVLRVANE